MKRYSRSKNDIKDLLREGGCFLGIPLNIPIEVSSRMTTTYGCVEFIEKRGVKKPLVLKFNKDILEFEDNVFKEIVLHELVHYYLYIKGFPYGHTLKFKEVCESLGIPGRATLEVKNTSNFHFRYDIICKECNNRFYEQRIKSIDKYVKRYHCAYCKGDLLVKRNY